MRDNAGKSMAAMEVFMRTSVRPGIAPVLRQILAADALVEFLVALGLCGLAGRSHEWFGVDRAVTLVASGVFLVAGFAIGFLAWFSRTRPAMVRQLAVANIAGGVVGWAALVLMWGRFEPEGRWLLSAGADAFILLGVLELFALRRTASDA